MAKKIDFLKSVQVMSDMDITSRIKEDEMRLKKLQFAHTISPLENPMTLRSLRKDISRLKTELKKREMGV